MDPSRSADVCRVARRDRRTPQTGFGSRRTPSVSAPDKRASYTIVVDLEITWNEIIGGLGYMLLQERNERQLRATFKDLVLATFWESTDHDYPDDVLQRIAKANNGDQFTTIDKASITELESRYFDQAIVQLRALGIVQHGIKRRPPSDTNVYWCLTPYGDTLFTQLSAIRSG